MTNNDVIRKTKNALDLSAQTMIAIFKLGGVDTTVEELKKMMTKEEEPGFEECADSLVGRFLDGLIVYKRGPKPEKKNAPPLKRGKLSNNDILKKFRIALELQEEGMLDVFRHGDKPITGSELTALFRNKEHKHYKECGDQYLRAFLKGFASYLAQKTKEAPKAQ